MVVEVEGIVWGKFWRGVKVYRFVELRGLEYGGCRKLVVGGLELAVGLFLEEFVKGFLCCL